MLFFSSTKNYIKRFSVKIVMLPNLRTKLGRCVFLIFHVDIYPKVPLWIYVFFLFYARSGGNLFIYPAKNKMHLETWMQGETAELESSSGTPA